MAKPVVDGLEVEMGGALVVIHLDLLSSIGRAFAAEHGVHIVPVTLLFDARGRRTARYNGVPDADDIRARIAAAMGPA